LERLFEGLQQWTRNFGGVDRPDDLEPLRASILEAFDLEIGDVLAGQRDQLITNEVHDAERFGFLVRLERQALEQELPLQPDLRHLGLEPSPVLVHPRDGFLELSAVGGHGLFGLGPHVLRPRRRQALHLPVPALAEVLAHQTGLDELQDGFEVLDLSRLTTLTELGSQYSFICSGIFSATLLNWSKYAMKSRGVGNWSRLGNGPARSALSSSVSCALIR